MKNTIRGAWVALLFLTACNGEQKTTQKFFNFDQLISDQVQQLGADKVVLEKSASVGDHSSDTTFSPSAKGWETELEVFRQMELLNKPTYQSGYVLNDPVKDTKSNLSIRRYSSSDAPVTLMKFYYHEDFAQLKKIEATISESNFLFSSGRDLVMEFEENNGKSVLQRFTMSGFQKMAFRDTVRFSIIGQIGR